nr:NAC domain-containing protein 18-like [Coffea arabica]
MDNLPFGVRFCPTDEELITHYLKNKVTEQPLPSDKFTIERDIYGENETATPWILFGEDAPWQTPVVDAFGKVFVHQKVLYVFTKLLNVGKSSDKNKKRIAGCGNWHNNSAPEPIMKNWGWGYQLIGNKRTFTYRSKEETVGHWTMHEYELAGASLQGINLENNYVLCKIKRDDSKSSKGGRLLSWKNSRFAMVQFNEDDEVIVEPMMGNSVPKATLGKRKSVSGEGKQPEETENFRRGYIQYRGDGIESSGLKLVQEESSTSVNNYSNPFDLKNVKQVNSNGDSSSTMDDLFQFQPVNLS